MAVPRNGLVAMAHMGNGCNGGIWFAMGGLRSSGEEWNREVLME